MKGGKIIMLVNEKEYRPIINERKCRLNEIKSNADKNKERYNSLRKLVKIIAQGFNWQWEQDKNIFVSIKYNNLKNYF